jgi:hypothetical protein
MDTYQQIYVLILPFLLMGLLRCAGMIDGVIPILDKSD